MVGLIFGIAAAVGAATLYSLGIALQAADAKAAPASAHLRLSLLSGLAHRKRWLLGTSMSVLGWPLQVLALLLAPLVVVQPTLAAGLIVLLACAGRLLDEHPGRSEHVAVAAIVIGVAGMVLSAPAKTASPGTHPALAPILIGLALVSLAPYFLRALGGRTLAPLTILGAGCAYGWTGVSTKLVSNDLSHGHLIIALLWATATGIASIVAFLSEMSALQARPAIEVAPAVFVTQTVIPVVLAPLVMGEHFASGWQTGAPLALSLLVLLCGASLLSRSSLLLALTERSAADNQTAGLAARSPES